MNLVIKILSTVFFVGYLPLMPGTFGTIAGLWLYLSYIKGNPALLFIYTLIFLFIGLLVTGKAEKLFNRKDPKNIVIDEVCGILICFLFIPFDVRLALIGFVIFRILDAVKPYPCSRVESLKGSLGIMSDDIIAGFYTNIVLQVFLRLASFKVS
ncbi:phosphatidylglycerophosphatase A [bacterium]|nr:MAG: phosphatidylglycerophosphatase A [bacterium]